MQADGLDSVREGQSLGQFQQGNVVVQLGRTVVLRVRNGPGSLDHTGTDSVDLMTTNRDVVVPIIGDAVSRGDHPLVGDDGAAAKVAAALAASERDLPGVGSWDGVLAADYEGVEVGLAALGVG